MLLVTLVTNKYLISNKYLSILRYGRGELLQEVFQISEPSRGRGASVAQLPPVRRPPAGRSRLRASDGPALPRRSDRHAEPPRVGQAERLQSTNDELDSCLQGPGVLPNVNTFI